MFYTTDLDNPLSSKTRCQIEGKTLTSLFMGICFPRHYIQHKCVIHVKIFIALQCIHFSFYTKAIINSNMVLICHNLQQFVVYTLAMSNTPLLMLYLLRLLQINWNFVTFIIF